MFLYLSIVFIGFFLLAYFLRILRAPFFSIAENSLSLVNILLLKIDEDEKVKQVQKANNKLIVSLTMVLLSIAASIAVGSIPFVLYFWLSGNPSSELDLTSAYSIISLTLGSTLGFIVPLKKKTEEGYSELSQLLHRMGLNNYAIAYKLFKMERKKLKKGSVKRKNEFVIISGLARAGTTSLMNKLAENEKFASLSYANMPFLTAPNLWKKFYNPKSGEKKERSHQDGIMIGLDSTEALEEYFFKVISNDSYIHKDSLSQYELTNDQYSDYMDYQAVVRSEEEKTYLAKNNNFILRYDSIRELNKEFTIVFMYRDPLTHAASLMEKHKEYSALQKEDSFVLEYMDWLGHHEFGLNQKTFQFNDSAISFNDDKSSLDYWLQVWINYYSHLLKIDKTHTLFIDYDSYCKQPKEVLESVYQKAGMEVYLPALSPFDNKRKVTLNCSEQLKAKAEEIYAQLKKIN